MSNLRIGFVLTGSFCTFAKVMPVIRTLIERGDSVTPILSDNAGALDTRFGTAAHWREELTSLTGLSPIDSIVSAEPIGPKALFDVLVVAPCTGNTLANLGTLLNRRHYYFVPLRQDAPHSKPRSLVAEMTLVPDTIDAAMNGKQLQPILLAPNA